MEKDLIEACKMFLVPASVLFAALGIARTEGLKTGISFIGLVVSGAWLYRVIVWETLSSPDRYTALAFAGVFVVTALVSVVVHGSKCLTGGDEIAESLKGRL
jgi:hypothetical protein